MAVPTGSPAAGSGGTPAKTLADTLVKIGCVGLEQPSQTKPRTAATSCPHGPIAPAKDSPDSHQHYSAH